jgi:hypothetical protein
MAESQDQQVLIWDNSQQTQVLVPMFARFAMRQKATQLSSHVDIISLALNALKDVSAVRSADYNLKISLRYTRIEAKFNSKF